MSIAESLHVSRRGGLFVRSSCMRIVCFTSFHSGFCSNVSRFSFVRTVHPEVLIGIRRSSPSTRTEVGQLVEIICCLLCTKEIHAIPQVRFTFAVRVQEISIFTRATYCCIHGLV